MKKQSLITLISSVLLSSFVPVGAMAEGDDGSVVHKSDSTYRLRVLNVFGVRKSQMSRFDVPLKDLPVSISTISMEPLKIRGIFDFQEATRFTTATHTRTTYGAFQQVSVRGFDYSPIEIDGMRDERTTWNSFPLPDLTMVESLEVIKGPSSILGGHSSVGGLVNIIRKTATNIPTLELFMSAGSWGKYQASGTIGGSLAKGIHSLLNFNTTGGEGWRARGDRRFSLYNNTVFQLAPQHTLDLRLSLVQDYYGTEAGLPKTMPGDITNETTGAVIYKMGDLLRGLDRSWRYNNPSDFMWNKNRSVYLRYNWYMSDRWKLSNKAMYSHDIIDYFSTEELTYPTSNDPIYAYSYLVNGKKKYIDLDHVKLTFPLRFHHVARTVQNHLDLNGKFEVLGIRNNVMFGASYTLLDRHSFRGNNVAGEPYSPNMLKESDDVFGPGVNALVNVYDPKSAGPMYERFSSATRFQTQVVGLFFQDMIEFSDQLKALVALRYNNYGIKQYPRHKVVNRSAEYISEKSNAHLIYNALTYRVGVVYEPLKDLSFYGSISNFFVPDRSSRSLNPKTIYINKDGKVIDQQTADFSKAIFDPMTGYQAELGTGFILGRELEGRVSVFHIRQNNLVRNIGTVQEADATGQMIDKAVMAQVGTVLSSGFEAEMTYTPLVNLSFSAGYGFTNARYGEIASNQYNLKGSNVGDPLNYIPKHTFFTYGQYVMTKGRLKGVSFNYSATYTDKIYRNYGSGLYYDPYFLLNLGVHYTVKKGLTLGLQVNNVLNKEYFAQSLGNQLMPAEPRNFKLMLQYKIW